MEPALRCRLVVLAFLCTAAFKEVQAQGAFGMDGTADASAASGMMGMTGYNPGQGASFVSAGTKVSEEIRIVAAAGNASLCWGIVDARMGLASRVVGLQPCSPRSHGQKWLLRRVGANLQIHPALFSHECLELATQPGNGNPEVGGELEWSRLQSGSCHPRQSPLAARQSFRLDSQRRLNMATNQNLCIAASGDRPGSVFLAVVCDETPLQRIFMPAFGKATDGSRWFTEVLYGGAEEPHCLGVGSNTLLAVEQCRYSGLALSRQLFTILGGGDWVVLQPSAQWGQCIGLEHVEADARGQMHEEAREAGHHIAAQACTADHSGQAWMFDEWDRLRVPDTEWCLSAPMASEGAEGLLSLQRCANVKEQRFYVHPHQIAKQVAPEEMLGQAYGLGRGQESATLFGPYPSTPRVHAPSAPNVQQDQPTTPIPTPANPAPAVPTSASGQTGDAVGAAESQAGSASAEQPGQFSDGVKRGDALADGQRRSGSGSDMPGVSQSEFLNFCRKVEAQGASVTTLQAAGCPLPSETPAPTTAATPPHVPSPDPTPAPVVPELLPTPSPVQQEAPVVTPSPSAGGGGMVGGGKEYDEGNE
ncbi:hypothetical protein WJX84_005415 [Apatococcus fuscideae]|uniref:Ricin B lectin domain-containing protein n=1 Tax=Apatococcus fuscideae TaxID=2026836 RepID=A0AAW1SNP0_9CHLO